MQKRKGFLGHLIKAALWQQIRLVSGWKTIFFCKKEFTWYVAFKILSSNETSKEAQHYYVAEACSFCTKITKVPGRLQTLRMMLYRDNF